MLISPKKRHCHDFWVCPFRNIRLSELFRHVLSSRPLGSFFSCHMHSPQCVAMGAAGYVKLSRAFTTLKCNFRQEGQWVSFEQTVSSLLNTHALKAQVCWFSSPLMGIVSDHEIVMFLPCAGPPAPSTVVPMQNRRSASAESSLS